jgi:hypothetical protein
VELCQANTKVGINMQRRYTSTIEYLAMHHMGLQKEGKRAFWQLV